MAKQLYIAIPKAPDDVKVYCEQWDGVTKLSGLIYMFPPGQWCCQTKERTIPISKNDWIIRDMSEIPIGISRDSEFSASYRSVPGMLSRAVTAMGKQAEEKPRTMSIAFFIALAVTVINVACAVITLLAK